ncbi:uncharacterized protein [Haliotis cracherodii]|uniref:uncharacterized protein n=1 Tax=Haliotis cracherodii TaxID=6455 RepID=UPI0039E8E964
MRQTDTKRAQKDEALRAEIRRADDERERAERERKNADEAKEKAYIIASRAKDAEERAQKECQRANEEKEQAERERKAAAQAKEEAVTNARRAEQAKEQAQTEKRRALEAHEIAKEERERAEEARAHAEDEAKKSEEMRQKKESAEQEKQRLLDEKDEKQRRDESFMKFSWGPKKTNRGTSKGEEQASMEVKRLCEKFYKLNKDKEGKVICGKILIFGPSGAGKSSFCNGLRSALMDYDTPANYYAVGLRDGTLTKNFQAARYGHHWVIDMPGIFESSLLKTENIEAIASGRVRFDAEITETLDVKGNLQEARRDVSCVVLVLHHGITLGEELKRQLDVIIQLGGRGALSYHLVLTHLDECDSQFKDPDNLPNLYTSPRVQEAVKNMSEQTGIPPYAISYVKNYVTETETDTNTKLLHLRALDRILTSTADQVEKMIDNKLQKKMYEDAPDTEETQAVSEEKKLTSTDWTIQMSIFAVVILFVAVAYMFIQ